MKAVLLLAFLSFFLFISVASKFAYAEGEVSLEEFPQELANKLGTDLVVGQLLATLILLCLAEFPTLMLTRGKSSIAPLIVGIPVFGATVAIGWLPVYLFAVLCLIIGLLYANKLSDLITGGRQS